MGPRIFWQSEQSGIERVQKQKLSQPASKFHRFSPSVAHQMNGRERHLLCSEASKCACIKSILRLSRYLSPHSHINGVYISAYLSHNDPFMNSILAGITTSSCDLYIGPVPLPLASPLHLFVVLNFLTRRARPQHTLLSFQVFSSCLCFLARSICLFLSRRLHSFLCDLYRLVCFPASILGFTARNNNASES